VRVIRLNFSFKIDELYGFFVQLKLRFRRTRHQKEWARVLEMSKAQDKFTTIYKKRLWKGSESVSGFGSGYKYTENLRNDLPRVIAQLGVSSIFDAGCGDFNWMKSVISSLQIDYLGVDIVEDLIAENNHIHSNEHIKFAVFDITQNSISKAELIICRDVLFHLSNHLILAAMQNFLDSGANYFLLTSHVNFGDFKNTDIVTGDFRRLDIFSSPFSFPKEYLYEVEDWMYPDPPRKMHLFSREQFSKGLMHFNLLDNKI
jgi:hypothetical protein